MVKRDSGKVGIGFAHTYHNKMEGEDKKFSLYKYWDSDGVEGKGLEKGGTARLETHFPRWGWKKKKRFSPPPYEDVEVVKLNTSNRTRKSVFKRQTSGIHFTGDRRNKQIFYLNSGTVNL